MHAFLSSFCTFLFCLIILSNLHGVETAKIAVFTIALSNSQVVVTNRIAEILANGGHQVVIIRPTINPAATSLVVKHDNVREIRFDAPPKHLFEEFTAVEREQLYGEEYHLSWLVRGYQFKNKYANLLTETCKRMVNSNEFTESLRKEYFDFAIQSHMDLCGIGFIQLLGIRKWAYSVSSPPMAIILNNLGIPTFSSIQPEVLSRHSIEMSFSERMMNFIIANTVFYLGPMTMDHLESMIFKEKYGNDFRHLSDVKKTAAFGILNSMELLEFPLLRTDKVLFLGDVGMMTTNNLTEPFASFYKKSKKIVLVSFGSVAVAAEMPPEWKNTLIQVFYSNPDISFIWKFEEELEVPNNVLISKWAPQTELLGLPKTVAFITHGGYNSVMESVVAGKPCLMIPLLADQYRNAKLAEYRGIGKTLNKPDMKKPKVFNEQFQEFIKNERYARKARELKEIIRSDPIDRAAQLLHRINLTLKSDLDMNLPLQDGSFISYLLFLNIDVALVFLLFSITPWVGLFFCCRRLCCSRKVAAASVEDTGDGKQDKDKKDTKPQNIPKNKQKKN